MVQCAFCMVSPTPIYHILFIFFTQRLPSPDLSLLSLIMATPSTSYLHRWKYDVFVSFRGEDIRKGFRDHLFKDFEQKGINAFKDDDRNLIGKELPPVLCEAIEGSWFLIVIFSKNFADSLWCLRELTKILECRRKGEPKHEVRFIYYDVRPHVVRKQTESYAEAFSKHEISNTTEVAKWKESLYEATNFIGRDLQDFENGYESKLIDDISENILDMACHIRSMNVGEKLVGVDDQIEKLDLSSFIRPDKVHMFGICGISGIGKTTLARAIYNKMFMNYKRCCFFEDVQGVVKNKSITEIQMLIINTILKTTVKPITNVSDGIRLITKSMASEPILLVLDDVDDRKQLEALAGSPDWFCPGSFIIFTSKDKQLLNSHYVEAIYDMPILATDEALELFSLHAFREKCPTKDFKKLSYQVVNALQGHPLALKVWGTHLFGKYSMSLWQEEVVKLQKYQNKEIQQKLRPSFDELDSDQKKLFLDIACSFIGENENFVTSVLKSDDCFPLASIEVLLDKSLITKSPNDSLQMHELIRSMAREIVREKSKWITSDAHNVLDANQATEAVEVFDLLLEESGQKVKIEGKAFARMKNLRILKICDKEVGEFQHAFEVTLWKDSKVNYSGRLEFLSNELRLLYWHGCLFELFPSDFCPKNIVAIDLSYSRIKNLWTTAKCFERLEIMKLKHCRNLISTPDFTMITNLKELILEGCVNLVEVHPSVGLLKRLVVLDMRNCKRFKGFPCEVEMDSLEVMDLSGCSKVDKLPENIGTIQTMKELCVVGTAITEFPVVSHCNLEVLKYGGQEMIQSRWWTPFFQSWSPFKRQHPQGLLMPSLESFRFLRELEFRKCNLIELHDSIGSLSNLESLELAENNFTSLPRTLTKLSKLKYLSVYGCKNLEVLPQPPRVFDHQLCASFCTSLKEVEGLSNFDRPLSAFIFEGCPNMFRSDLAIESQASTSQLQPVTPSITSHSSRNQFSDVLEQMNIPSNICRIFMENKTYGAHQIIRMVYHGNKIPRWFTTQSMGSHVKVELPQNLCGPDIHGYAICVILTPKKSHRFIGDYHIPKVNMNYDNASLVDHDAFYYNTTKDHSIGNHESEDDSIEPHASKDDSIGNHETDIIYVCFWRRNWHGEEAKNFVTFSIEYNDDFEVKEFGARLIFKEDIQEGTDHFSIVRDLPTPTQDGGHIFIHMNYHQLQWSWSIVRLSKLYCGDVYVKSRCHR